MRDYVYYGLWYMSTTSRQLLLQSKNFKFLLEAACHQYDLDRNNDLYIRKVNFKRWVDNQLPNDWLFFLDFTGSGKSTYVVTAIVPMQKKFIEFFGDRKNGK